MADLKHAVARSKGQYVRHALRVIVRTAITNELKSFRTRVAGRKTGKKLISISRFHTANNFHKNIYITPRGLKAQDGIWWAAKRRRDASLCANACPRYVRFADRV